MESLKTLFSLLGSLGWSIWENVPNSNCCRNGFMNMRRVFKGPCITHEYQQIPCESNSCPGINTCIVHCSYQYPLFILFDAVFHMLFFIYTSNPSITFFTLPKKLIIIVLFIQFGVNGLTGPKSMLVVEAL